MSASLVGSEMCIRDRWQRVDQLGLLGADPAQGKESLDTRLCQGRARVWTKPGRSADGRPHRGETLAAGG
eukprot:10225652-Alexandrium_andersonii.AAC.1